MGNLAGAKHVGHQGEPLRLHGLEKQLGDGRQVVRLRVEGTVIAMSFFVGLEPRFIVESFGLNTSDKHVLALCDANLAHVFKHFFTRPSWEATTDQWRH